MEKDDFLKILSKVQGETASEDEKTFVEAYDRLFDKRPDGLSSLSPSQVKALEKRIRTAIGRDIGERRPIRSLIQKSYRWWVAASLIILVSAGLLVYLANDQREMILYTGEKVQPILPSGKGAILTLGNGQRIDLSGASKGVIAVQGATRIVKTPEGVIDYTQTEETHKASKLRWNAIATPRGSLITILLPDGSKAHLNAGSSLRFPSAFGSLERKVELSGEADFEVVHQPSRPFLVVSAGQKVEVLGTHFNIRAYRGDRWIKTTLLQGRIALSTSLETMILKPGQQGSIASGRPDAAIAVRDVADVNDAIAWRNGIFHFENASIQEVMEAFSLWYDVDIAVEGGVRERLFSGDIHKTLTLQKALQLLNYHHVYFEIDGRKIRVRT